MIRRATLNDLDACVVLTSEFFAPFLSTHGVKVRDLDVRKVAFHAIQNNQLLVVEHDGKVEGITSWMVIPHPANNTLKIFYETIWCVKSKFKTDVLLLLRALEREALLANADLMLMANLSDIHEEQLKRIFIKRGFNFLETHYGKTLKQ
jgi:hypothetical protein